MDNFGDIKNVSNVMANKSKLLWVQDSTSLVIGIGAGVLQLESLQGFYTFVGGYLGVAILYTLWICQLQPYKYYQNPVQDIVFDSFFRELTGFVMAWTFSYALVG